MPKYQVSYETTTEPKSLPPGAVVTKVSVLPVEIQAKTDRTLRLGVSGLSGATGYFEINEPFGERASAKLNDEELRELRTGISELLDDGPDELPTVYLPYQFSNEVSRTIEVTTKIDKGLILRVTDETGGASLRATLTREQALSLAAALIRGAR